MLGLMGRRRASWCCGPPAILHRGPPMRSGSTTRRLISTCGALPSGRKPDGRSPASADARRDTSPILRHSRQPGRESRWPPRRRALGRRRRVRRAADLAPAALHLLGCRARAISACPLAQSRYDWSRDDARSRDAKLLTSRNLRPRARRRRLRSLRRSSTPSAATLPRQPMPSRRIFYDPGHRRPPGNNGGRNGAASRIRGTSTEPGDGRADADHPLAHQPSRAAPHCSGPSGPAHRGRCRHRIQPFDGLLRRSWR